MSYQALARKYRPQTFEDILGQESVVQTLRNSIEGDRIHQAYLFSGVRGVGKTSAARIFAKALNCLKGPTATPCNECVACREITEGIDLDVREIDAATYTQVESIRDLREVSQFQPARDRYRIFIIDEAHMLSTAAWNALLKLIEEPPPHVIFVLATTELQKVPQTITSRVQKFTFRRITREELHQRLADICRKEGIEVEDEALAILARRGDGSVRDAISLLDQAIAFSGSSLSAPEVAQALGLSDQGFFGRLLDSIDRGDMPAIVEQMDEAAEAGRDFKLLYRDLLGFLRTLLLVSVGAPSGPEEDSETASLRDLSSRFDSSEILRLMNVLIRDDELVTRSEQQRLVVELSLLKAAMLPRLREIEEAVSGSPAPQPRERPARADAARAPARPSGPATRSTGPSLQSFIAKVSEEKRLAGQYLGMAASSRVDEETIELLFDEQNEIARETLAAEDTSEVLTRVAAEVFGRPMKIVIGSRERIEKKTGTERAAPDEDPVLKAFARHLGGEVVRE